MPDFHSIQALAQLANKHLLAKSAFVDPTTMGAGGGAPPGGDPSMGGGMPPGMDPSMMGGGMPPSMDPSMMGGGGAPPPPPDAGGGGFDPSMLAPMIQQAVQQAMGSSGGGAGGGGGGAGGGTNKVKVDTNAVLLQILKVVLKMANYMGVQIDPSIMVPTGNEMDQLASVSQSGNYSQLLNDGSGGGPGGGQDAFGGIPPMQGASLGAGGGGQKQSSFGQPFQEGRPFQDLRYAEHEYNPAPQMIRDLGNRSMAIANLLRKQA